MSYNTILTSKGTTTIPVEIRKRLGIKPGMQVLFTQNKKTGEYVIKRAQTITELRLLNKKLLTKKLSKTYKSGDGFSNFVLENQGQKHDRH